MSGHSVLIVSVPSLMHLPDWMVSLLRAASGADLVALVLRVLEVAWRFLLFALPSYALRVS